MICAYIAAQSILQNQNTFPIGGIVIILRDRRAMKRIVSLVLFLVLFLVPAAWAKDGHIDILMLNDTHSQLQPVSMKLHGIEMKLGGFVSVAEWVQAERSRTPDAGCR